MNGSTTQHHGIAHRHDAVHRARASDFDANTLGVGETESAIGFMACGCCAGAHPATPRRRDKPSFLSMGADLHTTGADLNITRADLHTE